MSQNAPQWNPCCFFHLCIYSLCWLSVLILGYLFWYSVSLSPACLFSLTLLESLFLHPALCLSTLSLSSYICIKLDVLHNWLIMLLGPVHTHTHKCMHARTPTPTHTHAFAQCSHRSKQIRLMCFHTHTHPHTRTHTKCSHRSKHIRLMCLTYKTDVLNI